MKKNPEVYLQHICEAIGHIEEFMREVSGYEEFAGNFLVLSAVVRQLEIIGEAAGQIDDKTRGATQMIPWKEIRNMRNRLIHEYFEVDTEVVWKTVSEDLPILKRNVIKELEKNRDVEE